MDLNTFRERQGKDVSCAKDKRILRWSALLRTMAVFLTLLSLVFMPSLSQAQDATSPANEAPLKIAINSHYAPFTVVGPDGKPAGLLIDMWRAWSKATGRPIKFVVSGWPKTLENLRTGAVDIHSGLFETDARKEWMAFSGPIHKIKTGVFFRASDTKGIRSLSDMAGQRVGVLRDTYQHQVVAENYPDLDLVIYDDGETQVKGLLSGQIDAVANEVPFIYSTLDAMGLRGAVRRSPEDLLTNTLHASVKKGREDLAQALTEGFAKIPTKTLIAFDERWLIDQVDRYYRPAGIKVALNNEEEQWLKTNSVIRLAVTTFIKPVDIVDDKGNYSGLNADLIRLLNEKLGTNITPEFYPSWSNVVDNTLSGAVDGALSFSRTPDRERHVLYTAPYAYDPLVVLTDKDTHDILSFSDLKGRTVSMLKGIAFKDELLAAIGPKGKLIEVDDDTEALRQVVRQQTDAHISHMIFYGNAQRANFVPGLKVAASKNLESGALRIGVHKSKPVLFSILNKGLGAITRDELADLRSRWLVYVPKEKQLATLTDEEQLWIAEHSGVKVGIMSDWPPFNKVDTNGQSKGISAQIIAAVAKQTGLDIKLVPDLWKNIYPQLVDKKIDALMDVTPTAARQPLMNFTSQYLAIPHAIIALKDMPNLNSELDLLDKTIALENGFGNVKWFRENHPGVTIREYPSTRDALEAVAQNKADAYVGNRAVATFIMQREVMHNLNVHGRLSRPPTILAIGTRKDDPLLQSIMQKGLNAIPLAEMQAILQHWTGSDDLATGTQIRALSEEEKLWAKINTVRVGVEKWPPIAFINDEGQAAGLSGDYLALLAKRTGLRFEIVGGEWEPLLTGLKNHTIDLLPDAYFTDERATYGLYSEPYFKIREFLYVKDTNTTIHTLDDLAEGRIAVVKGYGTVPKLKARYPKVEIIETKDLLASINAVLNGDADALLEAQIVTQEIMRENAIVGLKGISQNVFDASPIHLLSRGDLPILQSILQKGLETITPEEIRTIQNKWIAFESVPAEAMSTEVVRAEATTGLWTIVAVSVLIFAGLVVFIRLLLRSSKGDAVALQMGSKRFRFMIIGTILLLALLVASVSWVAYDHNKNRIVEVTGINLQTVLNGTVERLKIWVDEGKSKVELAGRDPELVKLTKLLLTLPQDKMPLQFSKALLDIRTYFKGKGQTRGTKGFFIITPEGISIGSMRDENLASKNLIATQAPDLFKRVVDGEAVFIAPIRSDVHLKPGVKGDALPPTMFFAAPIVDEDGTVLAVLTNRIDPAGDFSRIIQTGNVGNTGETYAFNSDGLMMSNSRFYTDLVQRGLLKDGQPSALNIVLTPPAENDPTKLTFMAQSAVSGRSGLNLEGYDDYRGVKVLGAWTWIEDIGIGLTTEIDTDEALDTVNTLRRTILTILGLTLTLSAGATLFTLSLGERASASLSRAKEELEERVIKRTEEVQHQRDLIKAVMDSMTVGVAAFDENLKLIAWNQKYLDIRGYPAELVFEGTAFEDLTRYDIEQGEFGPGDPEQIFIEKVEGAHKFEPHAFDRQRPNGTFIEVLGGPIEGGGFVSTYGDITDRKLMQEELQAAEEYTRLILNSAGEGVFGIDNQGLMTFVNPAACHMLGYASEDMIGHAMHGMIHHTYADGTPYPKEKCHMRAAFMEGEVHHVTDEVLWRKDGTSFPVEYTSTPIEKDGDLLGAVVTFNDVTARRGAEEEIKRANFLADVALELTESGYWHVDYSDPDYYYQSERAANLLGEPIKPDGRYHLQDEWFSRLMEANEDTANLTAERYQGAIDGKYDSYEATYAYMRPIDQKVVWIHAAGKLVRDDDGKIQFMYGAYQDVTLQKQTEEFLRQAKEMAEAATKSKAAFLAAMSHEIRTPMNGVVGMISLLQETELQSDQRSMMNTVQDSAFSLLQIINDILDFSKIEAGKLSLEKIPVNIDTVLEGVTETLLPNVAKKNLRMALFIDPDIPEHVLTDQVRLRQILFNLAGNATKFTDNTPERQGKVTLRADLVEPVKDGHANVRLSIIDNGIGMKPEAVKKLFTPFTQADQSTTRKFGGTGLGLSICKTLTELMGGKISVESTYGKGSTFTATLSFEIAEEAGDTIRSFDLSGLNIAYCVKFDDTAEAVERYATAGGATVTRVPAKDIVAFAKKQTKKNPLDIFILGTLNDDQDRGEVIETLRSSKGGHDLRFVILTPDRAERQGMVLPDMVVVASAPVRKTAFMHGVAMAAGRASPEIDNEAPKLSAGARKAPAIEDARRAGELILVAEDNITNQDVIRRQLNVLGYACEIADDGMIAMEMLKGCNYGMLLTDCHMPNKDGYELTTALREMEVNTDKRLPVIAITANALQGEADRCLAVGMDDYLAKPLEMNKLKAMLAKWLPVDHGDGDDDERATEPEAASTDETPADESPADVPRDAVVNVKALTDMFGEDQDLLKEILGDYVEPSTDIIGDIDAGYKAHDAEVVGKAGHKLKSSSRAIGANALADLCAALEQAGKGGDWDEIEKLYPDLHPTFDAVVSFIENL